jgi:hypothetical protein
LRISLWRRGRGSSIRVQIFNCFSFYRVDYIYPSQKWFLGIQNASSHIPRQYIVSSIYVHSPLGKPPESQTPSDSFPRNPNRETCPETTTHLTNPSKNPRTPLTNIKDHSTVKLELYSFKNLTSPIISTLGLPRRWRSILDCQPGGRRGRLLPASLPNMIDLQVPYIRR